MASVVLPVSLVLTGVVFTAGYTTVSHVDPCGGWTRLAFRGVLYCGLVIVFATSEQVLWTALWLGALPSVTLGYHVWFCRQHHPIA